MSIFKHHSFSLLLLILFISSSFVFSQSFSDNYYRIIANNGEAIDIINDGKNNQLQLAKIANVSGQNWKFTLKSNNFYYLSCQWQGQEKVLDVVNDASDDKLILSQIGNYSGQFWKFEKHSSGKYYLSSSWLGTEKVLTAVSIGGKNQLRLQAKTATNLNQLWSIQELKSTQETDTKTPIKLNTHWVQNFKIIVPEKLENTERLTKVLDTLSKQITKMQKVVPAKAFSFFEKIPIWIEYKKLNDGAVWYHPNKNWLLENGYTAEMEKSVEIKNIENFINWQVKDQPYILLHELAHAFHDFLPESQKVLITNCFKEAVASRKYESVPYIHGGNLKHYALTNESEFFAEMSEAYFGKNDYFPFNRADLKRYDLNTFNCIQKIWENN